jgi:hypothetical protein
MLERGLAAERAEPSIGDACMLALQQHRCSVCDAQVQSFPSVYSCCHMHAMQWQPVITRMHGNQDPIPEWLILKLPGIVKPHGQCCSCSRQQVSSVTDTIGMLASASVCAGEHARQACVLYIFLQRLAGSVL